MVVGPRIFLTFLILLVESAVLFWYWGPLKREYPAVFCGLIGSVVLLTAQFMINPHQQSRFLMGLFALLMAFAVPLLYLYWYREPLERGYPTLYVVVWMVGVCAVMLLTTHLIWNLFLAGTEPPPNPNVRAALGVIRDPGMVQITVINAGTLDSAELTDPDGTRSTTMRRGELFDVGHRITLRSNDELISYLNDPENNITVLTTSGTKTVENVGELPSEYQKAPDGLINSEADTTGYDNTSVATVSCLFTHGGIEMGGRKIPGNVSIPCNTPVLAQNDSVDVGTSVKPTSGPNAGKTLTSPVTLRSGEYQFVGTADGEEAIIRRIRIDDETARR